MKNQVAPSGSDGNFGQDNGSIAVEMARVGLRMFGVGSPLVGTSRDLGKTNWLMQVGVSPVGGAVSFPKPFPTAVYAVVSSGVSVSSVTLTGFTAGMPCTYIAIGC